MIRAFLFFIALFSLSACSGAKDIHKLEKAVVIRAEQHPATADEYFVNQLESGASYEEQGVYLYGMGVAQERLGNKIEALNDYLAASLIGNQSAAYALIRLRKITESGGGPKTEGQ